MNYLLDTGATKTGEYVVNTGRGIIVLTGNTATKVARGSCLYLLLDSQVPSRPIVG